MKDLHFTADLVFKAEDIDDAMKKLGKEFMWYDKDRPSIFLGEVKCEPVEPK